MGRLVAVAIGVALLAGTAADLLDGSVPRGAAAKRPDVVVVLTDDMRGADWAVLPKTRRLVGEAGTIFPNFFLTTPVCCPSRSTILTGQYAHNHGVQTNKPGWAVFRRTSERDALPTWLKEAGYRTGLFGKYLNGYNFERGHVPPGWDRWYATSSRAYLDYTLNVNGDPVRYGDRRNDYLTDVLAREAVAFIEETKPQDPLFAYIAVKAPHGPATVAPRYRNECDDARVERGGSFDEADVSDKPSFVQEERLSARDVAELDKLEADRRCSLKAVDDLVESVVAALDAAGRLDNAYLFVLSDNGYLMGEHRLTSKGVPYDEAVRVPMLARGPGFAAGAIDKRLVGNLDLAPTIADIAGARPRLPVDGRSILSGGSRDAILLERIKGADDGDWEDTNVDGSRSAGERVPSYVAIRTADAVYVEYEDGQREYYDLAADPLQLQNLAGDERYADAIAALAGRLDALRDCRGDGCRAADGGGGDAGVRAEKRTKKQADRRPDRGAAGRDDAGRRPAAADDRPRSRGRPDGRGNDARRAARRSVDSPRARR